jgi:hypothetical protein
VSVFKIAAASFSSSWLTLALHPRNAATTLAVTTAKHTVPIVIVALLRQHGVGLRTYHYAKLQV